MITFKDCFHVGSPLFGELLCLLTTLVKILKPLNRLPIFTYSICRQRGTNYCVFVQSVKNNDFYGRLQLPFTYNGENGNSHFLESHSRYFDKILMVMSLEISSMLCMNLV